MSVESLFAAIKSSDASAVRTLLLADKNLLSQKYKDADLKFDESVECDSYKFIGAYLGQMTALHYAIMNGQDEIAKEIVERSFKEELDDVCGVSSILFQGGNTALILATFLGARDVVKILLEYGADRTVKNAKGFSPVDLLDDPEMRLIFEEYKH